MNRDKIIGFFLLIVMVIGYDQVFQYPRRDSLLKAQIQAKGTLKKDLYDVEDARDKTPKTEEEIKAATASLSVILNRFPRKSQNAQMMDVITSAIPAGFQAKNISPRFGKIVVHQLDAVQGEGKVPVKVEEVEIRIDFIAGFQEFGTFLSALEKAPLFFKIANLQVRSAEQETGISGSLLLQTFILDSAT